MQTEESQSQSFPTIDRTQLPASQSFSHRNRQRGIDSGTHFTFCGGLITVGPDWRALLASTTIIIAPSGVYLGLVAPYLGEHSSWAFMVISALLILFSLSMLAATALRDPGFIPRSPPDIDVERGLKPPSREYIVHDYTVTTKYCPTCNHYRPPRCSHCAVCDNCVDKFDHHCPWVGTCIGKRNYKHFLFFVFSTAILCCWVTATSIYQLSLAANARDGDWGEAVSDYPASVVLAIYCLVALCFVAGLSGLHSYLVCTNQTTYEHFRRSRWSSGNPYAQGVLKNCGEVFCQAVPPRHTPLGMKQREEDAQKPPPPMEEPVEQGRTTPGGGRNDVHHHHSGSVNDDDERAEVEMTDRNGDMDGGHIELQSPRSGEREIP